MDLTAQLSSGELLRWPGAASPLVAMMIERLGFDGVYVSGAGLAADLGRPDVGVTTLAEVTNRGSQIAAVTALPTIIDADTGFGDPRASVEGFAAAGLAACHLEDQIPTKRCGHLDGKTLVTREEMVRRLEAALRGRDGRDFVIIARTDARAVEGLAGAIDRLRIYIDAGADAVFPDGLLDAREIEQVRSAVDVPLIVNMTEFGKTELLEAEKLRNLGVNAALYPLTALRLANRAVEEGLRSLRDSGTQAHLLDRMQTREELYELLGYVPSAAAVESAPE